MSEDTLDILLIILIILGAILWLKTFIAIIKSDNIRIIKLIYFLIIISSPPLGIFYAIISFFKAIVKKDLENAPHRIKSTVSFSSKIIKWFFQK
jgi:TRAP-type C4-dicarboxylate transport system permease small subunit